ncbi:adenylate kinase [candidate division KSB1 bacterium]|nr:MAG: adenylate kinase [candidate division KSB1 bacterium]
MRLVLLGAPGVGKGVQGYLISKEYDIPKISTGDILRQEISENTRLGRKAINFIEKGELVPDEVINKIVEARLKKDDCKKGFLLDGYPRTIPQAEFLLNFLSDEGLKLDAVLNIKLDDSTITNRLSNRRICSKCGKDFNLAVNPPPEDGICPVCGGKIYQREDDRIEVIEERLKVYRSNTKPLVDFFREKGKLFEVDGNGSISEVHKNFVSIINKIKDDI